MYTIPIAENYKSHDYMLFYYPYQVTEWLVEYKPLPFMKVRKEKRRLITNLTRKETNFYDENIAEIEVFDRSNECITLPINYDKESMKTNAARYLKNHYIHKKKVWSYPAVTFLHTYSLYIPYCIGEKQIKGEKVKVLLEPGTGDEDMLIKYKEIQSYLKEKEVI